MFITVQNLTNTTISCDVGLLGPFQAITVSWDSRKAEKAAANLQDLESKGWIAVYIQADSAQDQKLVAGTVGIAPGSVYLVSQATAAPITLWVDPVSGNDKNLGSQSMPYKTVQKALDAIPQVVRHPCTINVRAGTVAESIYDNHTYAVGSAFSAGITVYGYDLATPTLASGALTGTLGSAPASGLTWSATIGSNWTSGDLLGKFIQVTSGAFNGRLYPIAGNGTATVDLPSNSSSLNGATFNVVTLGTTVTKSASGSMSFLVSNVSGSTSNGFTIQRLNLNGGGFYGAYLNSGTLQIMECWVDTGTFAGVQILQPTCHFTGNRSYVNNHGSNIGISMGGDAGTIFTGAFVINGGANGISATGNVTSWGMSGSGHTVVQGTTSVGVFFKSGPFMSSFSTQKWVIRNNTGKGIAFESGCKALLQFMEVTGNSSHGIWLRGDDYVQGLNSLNLIHCTITGNGGDGIRVETPHNAITLSGSTVVSSNTGVGVNLVSVAGQISASHNSVYLDSTVTMATNGNDLSVDGTNFSTVAALRAASGKYLNDAVGLYNRLAAQ
jgi:hypothetical protein